MVLQTFRLKQVVKNYESDRIRNTQEKADSAFVPFLLYDNDFIEIIHYY